MGRSTRIVMVGGVVAACLAVAGPAWAAKTVCSTGCSTKSIQTAIDGASPGATITIGKGNYYEKVVVNKPVTLLGSGVQTVIYPATSKPVCPNEGSRCGGSASNIILVEANDVTIQSVRLEGANPNLTGGVVVGGASINARNGIITNHEAGTFNNLTVSKVKVSDVYLRGIYASSGGTFNLNHDTVENVQGEEASIAMFNYGGSGVMESNKVTSANDAISANYSTGTQFLANVIKKSGSGIHTDNNGESGSADVIKGNTVRECKVNGYGIFVFVPYVSATVESNKISGCSVGLAAYGGAVSGQGPTFTNNSVNGTGAVDGVVRERWALPGHGAAIRGEADGAAAYFVRFDGRRDIRHEYEDPVAVDLAFADGVAFDHVGGAGFAIVVGMDAASRFLDHVGEELRSRRVVGRDRVVCARYFVAFHHARAAVVEHRDRRFFALDVFDRVVVEVERPARGGVDAAQVDVGDLDFRDRQVVEGSGFMFGDDPVARVDGCPANNYTAGQVRVSTLEPHALDRDVVCFDQDDVARRAAAA